MFVYEWLVSARGLVVVDLVLCVVAEGVCFIIRVRVSLCGGSISMCVTV